MLLPSRKVTAGTGLTGGGTLSHQDQSFGVNYGSGAGSSAQGNDTRFADTFSLLRSSDLTMAASTTVSLGLVLPYGIGETWTVQYLLHIQTTAGVGGIAFDLGTLPTNVVGRLAIIGPGSSLGAPTQVATTSLTSGTGGFFTFSGTGVVQVFLTVRGGTATGSIDLQMITGLLQAGTVYRESQIWARRN